MAGQSSQLPPTMKALVLHARDKPMVVDNAYSTPQAGPGSAVVRILASGIASYSRDVYNGSRPYPFPTPMVPGPSGIGRVEAVGPDSTGLSVGQLVWTDPTVRSRDSAEDSMLTGFMSGVNQSSQRLMEGEWRDGTYAQFARLPLENLFPLDEDRLLGDAKSGGLGLDYGRLANILRFMVPFGGLADINITAGETVIVSPASGPFGSSAVHVALAMGAGKVVAMARNIDSLNRLAGLYAPGKVIPVKLANDPEVDGPALSKALGGKLADAYFDISPPEASDSTHIGSCTNALRRGGRISLMGGIGTDFKLPYGAIMRKALTIKGTYMYTPDQARRFIALVESGCLRLDQEAGIDVCGTFGLEQWKEALDLAAEKDKPGQTVLIDPWL